MSYSLPEIDTRKKSILNCMSDVSETGTGFWRRFPVSASWAWCYSRLSNCDTIAGRRKSLQIMCCHNYWSFTNCVKLYGEHAVELRRLLSYVCLCLSSCAVSRHWTILLVLRTTERSTTFTQCQWQAVGVATEKVNKRQRASLLRLLQHLSALVRRGIK